MSSTVDRYSPTAHLNGSGRNQKLSDRQRAFVYEYLIDMNGTRAAVQVGYSPRTAAAIAHDLLDPDKYPLVAELVKEEIEKHKKKCQIEVHRLVEELVRIATLNPKRLKNSIGSTLPLEDLPDDVAAAVCEYEELGPDADGNPRYKYKFWNKLEALKQLAQHLGLLKDTVNINTLVQLVDWSSLHGKPTTPNAVEQQLLLESQKPQLPPKEVQGEVQEQGESNGR